MGQRLTKIKRHHYGWFFVGSSALLFTVVYFAPSVQPFSVIGWCFGFVCLGIGILLSAPNGWVEL